MNIQAVVFDADGVLFDRPLAFAAHRRTEDPEADAQAAEFFAGPFQDCLVGRADMRELLPAYLEKWRCPYTLDEYLNAWFEIENHVDQRLLDAAASLKLSGVACYVATNQERHRTKHIRNHSGIVPYFERIFASCEIGHRKPDAEFFQAVAHEIGAPAEGVLFWDDSPANVEASRRHGWHAELYTGFPDFSDKLRAYIR
jgi:putative hydrolase of the HAD superfamily